MRFLRVFLHYLGFPFVLLSFGIKFLRIKGKYQKYKNNPSSYPLEERYYAVYKLAKKAIYLKNYKIYTSGFDKIPTTPALYIANHKSSADPLMLFVKLYENRKIPYFQFIAKIQASKGRIGYALKLIDTIFIDRDNFRETYEMYQNKINPIKDKRSIVLFIEGTRVYEQNKLGNFHSGSLQIAYKNLIPIIPLVIYGSSGSMLDDKDRSFSNRHKQIFISCLEKISPHQFSTSNIVSFSSSLREKFQKEITRIDNIVQKAPKKYIEDPTEIFDHLDQQDEEKRY